MPIADGEWNNVPWLTFDVSGVPQPPPVPGAPDITVNAVIQNTITVTTDAQINDLDLRDNLYYIVLDLKGVVDGKEQVEIKMNTGSAFKDVLNNIGTFGTYNITLVPPTSVPLTPFGVVLGFIGIVVIGIWKYRV